MDAGKKKINDVLNGNRQLIVPFFQRAYVWTKDLWDRFLESMEQVSSNDKEYFLGSIILKQVSTSTSSNVGDVRTIVDGQQRLTTLTLFLKVLCFKIAKARKFENMFILDEGKYALSHNAIDRPIYESIVTQSELKPIENNSLLAQAYNYFLDKVEPEKLNLDRILSRVSFVGIDLNNEDDEQVIFDTINSIGVMLTTGELLKNYLFSEESLEKYEKTWKPTFEADEETISYWSDDTTQGRLIRKNIESFLYAYIHIKINDPAYELTTAQKERFRTANDLFSQYKDFMHLSQISPDELVDDLTCYAGIYRLYITPSVLNTEVSSTYGVERLNLIIFGLDSTTLIPYLLYLLKNQSDKKEVKEIARVIESYLMRRFVCKSSNDNYSDLFSLSLISEQYLYAENLKQYLVSKESDSSLAIPSDKELRLGFRNSVLQNSRAKGILYMIESMSRGSQHSTAIKAFSSYTLEHLMPKKWKPEAWPIDNPSDSENRNQRLKTLGNLAILTQSLNSSISNKSWAIKLSGTEKTKGLREYAAGLKTMEWALNQDVWDENHIDVRADILYELAKTIWTFEGMKQDSDPLLLFDVQSENNSASSIDKPKSTRRQKIRVTFPNGEEISKDRVVETFIDVIKYAGVEEVAKLNSLFPGKSLIVKEKPKDSRLCYWEIEGGHYVYTNTNTRAKYDRLLKINEYLQLGLKIELV